MSKYAVIMYADYPEGYKQTKLESFCMARAKSVCESVGIDFKILNYNQAEVPRILKSLKVDSMKPNEIADYIAYFSTDILPEYDKILKIDTDYFIYSPFILREIFKLDYSFVGTDVNNRLTDLSEFINPHITFKVKSSKLINKSVFKKYLNLAHTENRYSATGPHLCTTESVKINDQLPSWTSDPSSWSVSGNYFDHYVSHALGFHFQSSIIKDSGFEVTDIVLHPQVLLYTLTKLEDNNDRDIKST